MRRRPQGRGRSVDRGKGRPGIEPRNNRPVADATGSPGCRRCKEKRKAIPDAPPAGGAAGPRALRDPVHARPHRVREPGGPASAGERGARRPHREVQGHTPMMDGRGKSDSSVVPGKLPNKAEEPAAEAAEGRELAKGNSPERNALRTQRRDSALSALERVGEAARRDRKQRFTALLHHVSLSSSCGQLTSPSSGRRLPVSM